MISGENETIDGDFWKKRIEAAAAYRESLALPTNAYRLVFGEVDGIPSFILDRYGDSFSFQILSAGLECFREELLKAVDFSPTLLVGRATLRYQSRNFPKLLRCYRVGPSRRVIQEGELKFEVDLLEGQKTGAFLDQRDNRFKASRWSRNRHRALDAFSYQGWFACHMAQAATTLIAVDQSASACQMTERNAELNQQKNISVVESNVFDYLKEADQKRERFDLINLDPPAFVKSNNVGPEGYKINEGDEAGKRNAHQLQPHSRRISNLQGGSMRGEEFRSSTSATRLPITPSGFSFPSRDTSNVFS
jgi:23S rRNA (cytosine1962-C5)-methyltransferase